jgi:hypothetical protein
MPVLSRTQQNSVYQVAEGVGLDPLDFDLTIAQQPHAGLAETFKHRPTQSYIEFSLSTDKIWMPWWPAFGPGDRMHFVQNWTAAIETTVRWMRQVKADHDAPDLWAEAFKARQLTDAAGHTEGDNTRFTPAEIEIIKPKLDEIEAYIESRQPLDAQQKKIVRGRFQYLLDAAKRGLGRIDWINIFVGQTMQMFTDGVVNSSLYGEVMRHAWTALGSVIRIGSKLLGP